MSAVKITVEKEGMLSQVIESDSAIGVALNAQGETHVNQHFYVGEDNEDKLLSMYLTLYKVVFTHLWIKNPNLTFDQMLMFMNEMGKHAQQELTEEISEVNNHLS